VSLHDVKKGIEVGVVVEVGGVEVVVEVEVEEPTI